MQTTRSASSTPCVDTNATPSTACGPTRVDLDRALTCVGVPCQVLGLWSLVVARKDESFEVQLIYSRVHEEVWRAFPKEFCSDLPALLEAEMALCKPARASSVPSLPTLSRPQVSIADRPKWQGGVLATVGSYA